jgi:hypothetical protein
MKSAQTNHTDESCEELLKYLCDSPNQILALIAPEGWENSAYKFIYHPTAQTIFENSLRMHENMSSLFKKKGKEMEPPTLESIEKELSEKGEIIKPKEEFLDLLGSCLWCIFSNNHEVFDDKGVYDIGSFRGSGGFIGDFLNKNYPNETTFDYMDFYCADMRFDDDETSLPLFVYLFEKIKSANCDWSYSFPRIGIVSFDKEETVAKPEDYDPNKALEEELANKQKKAEIQEFKDKLDEIYESEMEEAKYKKPPLIIRAYQTVFGKYPQGWVY